MVFIVGSAGPKAQKVFQHQKEVVKEFITNKTNPDTTFTVITYGQDSTKTWNVDEPDKQKRNKLIELISWTSHGTRLDLGLEEAHRVLKTKPDAKKRVYIFLSRLAEVTSERVRNAVAKLVGDGTELVTIQIDSGDEEEKRVIPKTKFVVKSRVRDDPKRLAQLLVVTFYIGKTMGRTF